MTRTSAQMERLGVSACDSAFTTMGWAFREQGVADHGIDALVEVEGLTSQPSGRYLAVQIKGGPSYFKRKTDGGWREDLDGGESVAQMDLFKGAIGLFKNPSSHRRVDYSDATEAVETVLLADLLLRLLRKGRRHRAYAVTARSRLGTPVTA